MAGGEGLPFREVPRRIVGLVVVAVVAFAALAFVLARNSGKNDTVPAPATDTRARALAYAPRNAPALIGVDTGSAGASLVLGALVPRVSGGALTANDVSPLLGNEAVVALLDPRTGRSQLSMVAKDPDALRALARRLKQTGSYRQATLYQGPQGAAVAIKDDDTLIAASDQPTVRRALATQATKSAHLAPDEFDRRLAGLPTTADVRTIFDPKRIVVAQRLPGVRNTRWGRSLTNGAAVLEEGGPGLRLPFALQTNASRINDRDLPFAPGPQAPQIRGRARLLLGVRDLGRLIAFLRKADPQRLGGLDTLQNGLPGFLRVNVDGMLDALTNDGTISSSDALAHFAARTNPPDPSAWSQPLKRLSTLSSVLQRLGIDNIRLSEQGADAYRLDVDGDLVARVGVFGRTLVITDDANSNLRATATAPPAPTPPGARGGLTLRMQASEGRRLLSDLFGLPESAGAILGRLGDVTGWARAATDGVRGELQLGLR
jgi:hypothetical protein